MSDSLLVTVCMVFYMKMENSICVSVLHLSHSQFLSLCVWVDVLLFHYNQPLCHTLVEYCGIFYSCMQLVCSLNMVGVRWCKMIMVMFTKIMKPFEKPPVTMFRFLNSTTSLTWTKQTNLTVCVGVDVVSGHNHWCSMAKLWIFCNRLLPKPTVFKEMFDKKRGNMCRIYSILM